jgi:hypothetical protein
MLPTKKRALRSDAVLRGTDHNVRFVKYLVRRYITSATTF